LEVKAKSGGIRDKGLLALLVIAIVGAVIMLGYTIIYPPHPERFTEFYLLGLNGKAIDYPVELEVGEEGKVIVGIIDREQEAVSYRIEIRINGMANNKVGLVKLNPDEEWQKVMSFTPNRVGDRQKIQFLLYRQGQGEVYRELYLWINVHKIIGKE